ncbi:UPF0739 protein C1orf74 homolog [Actinia tenebrosa]|uniref:UPF0739 protein C1orf74 homolog n=1 Tax=Actinia tenebrosa TaxID=6105 RepID=A0A6P8GZ42_ACTTE|nr:UPF0739 protein C1orf74 homolog [Actinia tenebrosa]
MSAECGEWKSKMRKHLGKPFQKHYDSLMMDIILICIGLKPSLLFDYCFIDPIKVVHLLEDLHKSGMTTLVLDVVVLGQDFFITDINVLLKAMNKNLKLKSFSLIDVTGNLEQPRAVTEEIETTVCRQIGDLLIQLDQKSHLPGIPEEHFYNVDLQEEWNLSTMFGFLLCYPVIYWFDSKYQSNCLSLVPLLLHRAYLKLPLHVNYDLFKTFEEFANKLLKKANPRDLKILYSFSFPEQLNSVVEIHVQNWIKYVQKKSLAVELGVNDPVVFDRTHVVEKEIIL